MADVRPLFRPLDDLDWCWTNVFRILVLKSRYGLLLLSSGLDVIAQAQSGTGKTATFAISILQKIDISLRECQALVLAPTRELAQQVSDIHVVILLCVASEKSCSW